MSPNILFGRKPAIVAATFLLAGLAAAAIAVQLTTVRQADAVNICNGTYTVCTCPASGNCNGTEGNDTITGTSNADTIFAKGGDDTVYAGSGNDIVYAGSGNDTVHGQDGADTIEGDSGNDLLYGYDGNDTIYGGDGADNIRGMGGVDELYHFNHDTTASPNNANDNDIDNIYCSDPSSAADSGTSHVFYSGADSDNVYKCLTP